MKKFNIILSMVVIAVLVLFLSSMAFGQVWRPTFNYFTTIGRISIINDIPLAHRLFDEYSAAGHGMFAATNAAASMRLDAEERLSAFIEDVKVVDPGLYNELVVKHKLVVLPPRAVEILQ